MRPSRSSEHTERVADRREQLRATLREVITGPAEFVWEVGCGHGHFLAAYAASHPKQQCIGIDISSDRVARANRKRERARLGNLHFILADGEDFLSVMPRESRFAAIYVLFPDPWPKRRHHKNRIIRPEFLTAAAAAAKKGTRLFFRTDHEGYFLEGKSVIGAHGDWSLADIDLMPFEEPTVFQKRAARHFTLVATRR